jgi:crotonobetainyl-CoA:carnitine CoA-transferase CaiB-like acyl-CoA transferase
LGSSSAKIELSGTSRSTPSSTRWSPNDVRSPRGEDPRYATNADRRAHREELCEALQRRLLEQPAEHWLGVLAEAAVPCEPVQFLGEVTQDRQVEARAAITTLPHPHGGGLAAVRAPFVLADTPLGEAGPPALGAHTLEVLREAGVEETELAAALADGTVRGDELPATG